MTTRRMMTPFLAALSLGVGAFTLGAAVSGGTEARPTPPTQGDALAAHREYVRLLTANGGVSVASNAPYAAEDQGQTHYGQYFEALPGGLDARGCLWGERDGEVVGVYWRFFTGWDPITEKGFFYQSSRGGRVGFGHGGPLDDGGHWMEQRFTGPGGTSLSRHENHWFGTDSVRTRSYSGGTDGQWTMNREYMWISQPGRTPPC